MRVDTGAMQRFPRILPLDWNAAEVAEFVLIGLALFAGAGAIGCNFTASEELLFGRNASGWVLAGAWCTWIAVTSGTTCLALAFHGATRGPRGKRSSRHAGPPRYVWPEAGAQVVAATAKEPAARMDETQQAELARQLALVEAQGSLVMQGGPAAPREPERLLQRPAGASR